MRALQVRQEYAWLPWLIIVTAVIVLSVGALGFQYMESRLVVAEGESLALAAAEIADKLDWLISERFNDVRIFASAPTLQISDGAAVTEYIETLRRVYAPIYLWIGVTDARGRITAAAGSFTGTHDMGRSPWFRAVRENGEIHISDVEPFEEAGGIDALSFTAPIKDRQDKFLGAVTTRVGLPVLEDVLARTIRAFQAREGFTGAIEYQFLNDRGDAFIDSDLLHKGNVNLKRLGLPSALFSESGQPGYIEETHLRRHVPVITGYAQTQGVGAPVNVKWTILLRMDRADLLLPIRKVLWKLVAAGTLISAPMFVMLVWSTRRLRKEWMLAQQEHARAAEAESKYSALLESTDEGIYGLDQEGCLTFINEAGAAALGFAPQELLGRSMHAIHHHSRADGSPYPDQDCPIYQAFQLNCGCRVDTEVFWRRDGTSFPVEYASYPLFGDGGSTMGAVVTFTDITERKRAEEALHLSEQALWGALNEREQLIQDLHDGLIQSLYAIGMSMEECRRLTDEDPKKAGMKLGQAVGDVNAVIREVRQHLQQGKADLPFSAHRLKVELIRVVETMERAGALHFRLKVDPRAAECLTTEERREILYIAQEAMSNCLRHSGACVANVSLRLGRDRVCLEVEDDGRGFDTDTLRETNGGLRNIERRAMNVAAKVEIVSRRDHGTRIRLSVPIHA